MNLPSLLEGKTRNKSEVKYFDYLLDPKLNNLGKNKKYYLRTYGCQMNVHDSEKIKGMLESVGYTETLDLETSDLIILNTCAIRENAHDKVFGFLGKLKSLKKKNKNLIIGVCGCMSQEEVVTNEILNKRSYVDFVIGTHNLNDLLNIINKIKETNERQIEVFSIEGNVYEHFPHTRDSEYTAWVDIQLGCDKFCTYCIVPYTRGKQRSRKKESIIEEVKSLKNQGYKEVILLGQNVNAYGKDLYKDYDLSDLLNDVSDTNIERIRFITSHPWDFTDKMIDTISKRNNLMPYIHLPIQSGSNKILKLMGRRYTKEEYITLFNKIKKTIKDVSITTDIIVGFPGETDEDFNETLEVVKECKFDNAYTFIYSPREGTPAALMKDQITDEIKHKRINILNKKINYYSNLSNKQLENKIVKCLITGYSTNDDTKLTGYTNDMKLVNIIGDKKYIGQIVDVKIINTKSFSLDGIIE